MNWKRPFGVVLALIALVLASPVWADTDKPLVIKNGQIQQLPSTDTLALSNPIAIGATDIGSGSGAPPVSPGCATTDPIGSLCLRTDLPLTYVQWGSPTPARVQEATSLTGFAVTLGSTPTVGDVLFVMASREGSLPVLAAGWTQVGSSYNGVGATDPYGIVGCRIVQTGDGTSWTPATGASNNNSATIIEVSGLDPIACTNSVQSLAWTSANVPNGSISTTINATTSANNTLGVAMGTYVVQTLLATGATLNLNAGWGNVFQNTSPPASQSWSDNNIIGSELFATSGTNVTATISGGHTASVANGQTEALLLLQPAPSADLNFQLISQLAVIKSGGVQISPVGWSARSLNFGTGLSAADDGFGNDTITAIGAANVAQAGNTVIGNFTGSSAIPTANAMPSCTAAGCALNYTPGTGVGTNTSIDAATLLTHTWAAPGSIGGTTPGAGSFSSLLDSGMSGSGARCVHVDASGNLSATAGDCAAGGSGSVTSVTCDGVVITTSGVCPPGLIPQGRLTLVTATPVMTSDQTAKSQLFYDCYVGKFVPYFDGTNDQAEAIPSCEVPLTMQTSGTGVTNNAGVFDIWWVHSGANRICVATNGSGGGWASDTDGSNTARGTGYSQVHNTRGYWTNVNSIAHCYNGATDYGSISADQATYLGTLTTTAAGQTGVQFTAASAPGGSNAFVGLSNGYNRVEVYSRSQDSTDETATSATWKATSTGQRVSFVDGLAQTRIGSTFSCMTFNSVAAASINIGQDIDSTTNVPQAFTFQQGLNSGSGGVGLVSVDSFTPVSGLHFVQAMMNNGAASGTVHCGNSTAGWNQLLVSLYM